MTGMRVLTLVLVLAVATPFACAQRQQIPQPAPAPGAVRVEPNWGEVRSAQQQGQVRSVELLERAVRQQPPAGQKPGELLAELPGYITQSASTNAAVMIPLSAARAEATSLVTGKTFYNFSATYPGVLTSSVLGMCSGMRLPDNHPIVRNMQAEARKRPVAAGLGEPYQITATESGHQLTFSKFGCAYEIAITCEASCSVEKELLDIANSLVVINAR
jgi:hypothetical protein